MLTGFARSYLPLHMDAADAPDKINHLLDMSFEMKVSPNEATQREGRRLASEARHSWRFVLKEEAEQLQQNHGIPVRWTDLRADMPVGGYVARASASETDSRIMLRYDIAGPRGITGYFI